MGILSTGTRRRCQRHKVCRGSAGVKLKAVLKIDGFNAWRVLAFWFQDQIHE